MQKIPKKSIANKQWYNQRFDGSPLFLHYMGAADMLQDKRKPQGTNGRNAACFFSKGKADWYFDMEDINKGAQAMMRVAKKNKNISNELLKKWKGDEQKFEDFFLNKFSKLKPKKLSDQELYQLLEKTFELFTKATSSTSIIDRFALGTDEIIAKLLKQEVFGKRKDYRESEFVEIFTTLTAPTTQSFINEAEIDLIKIASRKSKMSLTEYQEKYFWLNNNYVAAKILSKKHFEKELKIWKKSGDLKATLKKLQQTPHLNKEKKNKLLQKIKISTYLKTLLKISDDFTWWQDQRKKFTYYNIHMGHQVLQEIGKRTDYTTEELKYTLLPEIKTILNKKNPSRGILKSRIKNCVFLINPSNAFMYQGKEFNQIKKIILAKQDQKKINDFRGLTACSGKITGKVKVIKSATQINKVEEGDILVAVMTRPDYISGMKKAAAIVTDEGGITCHAAIISRELGTPCVIGTKIATKILKDGDLVEVNANHGIITLK